MTKPTMTEFKKLSVEAQYALIDDFGNAEEEARTAQTNAIDELSAAKDAHEAEKAELIAKHKDELAAKDAEKADADAAAQATISELTAQHKDDLAELQLQLSEAKSNADSSLDGWERSMAERDAILAKLQSVEGTPEYKAKRLAEEMAKKEAAEKAAADSAKVIADLKK